MMSGTRNRSSVSVGHDAFLDIVANLVGILIILVVVLGSQSQSRINEASKAEPVDPLGLNSIPDDSASEAERQAVVRQLDRERSRASAETKDSQRLESTVKQLDVRIETTNRRRSVMLALLQKAEQVWTDKQAEMDQEAQAAAQRQEAAEKLKQELAEIEGERGRLEKATPEVIAISHLPTPMAKTVFGKEIYLRIKNDLISVVPLDELSEAIRVDFTRTAQNSRKGASDAVVGPIRGYVARYVMNRQNQLVSNGGKLAQLTRARVVLAAIEPVQKPFGQPVAKVLKDPDWLDVVLAGAPKNTTTVTIAVYPDSFDSFRKVREQIYAKGYATAARPLENGNPIYVNYAGGGTKSAAQ